MNKRPKNFIDMTGMQIGRWTVIEVDEEKTKKHSYFDGKRMRRRVYWKCKCSCDKHTEKSILGQNLRNGTSKSCGCWNKERDRTYDRPKLQKDMTGQTINYINVISKNDNKQNGAIHWNCKCLLCGKHFVADGRLLRAGQFSCGCIKSKGEFKITQILLKEKISFKSQFELQNLPKRYFDFAIFENNELKALIEYDGEQHFNKNSLFYSEKMIEHDTEKNIFCLNNNIKLYRIPYWNYNEITDFNSLIKEEYLVKEI